MDWVLTRVYAVCGSLAIAAASGREIPGNGLNNLRLK